MAERFDRYMARCLYDPGSGFYATGAGSAGGRRGDFITSPEVGPLFAEVVARVLDRWWDEAGRPAELPVYDAGTGPGTLARGLERAGGPGAEARRVVGFDHDGALPDRLDGAVVVANELLDNLPFRILERSADGWLEVWVDDLSLPPSAAGSPAGGSSPGGSSPGGSSGGGSSVGGPGRPVEWLEPLDPADRHLVPAGCDRLAPGARIPLLVEAGRWVAEVLARQPLALVAFDYGAPTTAELAARGGWLRTYRQHQRGDDPYDTPGAWDITTDVAVDQLPPPTEVVDQATFLRRAGIDELVAEGRRHWAAHAARPDLAALRMRSRISESEALLDPAGLGSWLVCLWR